MSEIKIVLVGSPQVGKSCILSRFVNDTFDELGKSTIGVSFLSKMLIVKKKSIKANIWDTAGQERFNSLTKLYSRDAQGIVFVYDITNKDSFEKMISWYNLLFDQGFEDSAIFAVVGNKEDLIDREVCMEEAKNFAKEINALYFRTSAKLGTGVEEIFLGICEKFVQKGGKGGRETIVLSAGRMKKKGCCE